VPHPLALPVLHQTVGDHSIVKGKRAKEHPASFPQSSNIRIIDQSRKASFETFGAVGRGEAGVARLDDPGQEIARTSIHVWRRRYGHENGGQAFKET
jgi:hypothetical protein